VLLMTHDPGVNPLDCAINIHSNDLNSLFALNCALSTQSLDHVMAMIIKSSPLLWLITA
jgi:hypothetical protein